MPQSPADELLDQAGRLRGTWRRVLGTLLGMGAEAVAERAAELVRACAEEVAASPGQGWRCDAIPFLLTETEFSGLAIGLAQRAGLLELVLRDVYGPRRLLLDGLLPPALVYGSGAYVRACRTGLEDGRAPGRVLQLYAADLVRGPEGWCVLADRTGEPAGLGYALENRRVLSRVLPEMFRGFDIGALRPFFDAWQDGLQRLAPVQAGNPGLALLTPGHTDPRWFEHVVLAQALGCALVEDEDLAVRGGALWIKTLRGLQPVHVLLRRQRGGAIDQLEAPGDMQCGAPGLMTAWRDGAVQVLNGPGAGWAEAPGLGAFLPAISRALTGRDLALDGATTLWLGDASARARVEAAGDWVVTSATDGSAGIEADRAGVAARPWAFCAVAPPPASTVPCLTEGGALDPRPVVLRLFLAFDGVAWRPLQGGLARVLAPGDVLGRVAPHAALTKDVWVLQEEGVHVRGPAHIQVPRLAIRRAAGDLPSRVADNFYWLGRYLERLETAARLVRIVLGRLGRGPPLPRDLPDFAVLTACLVDAGIMAEEQAGLGGVQLADLLVRALSGEAGTVARLLARVRDLADLLRDRLSGEMHAAMAGELRRLKGERVKLRPGQLAVGIGLAQDFTGELLNFCATAAGYTAENMGQGGGRLFLDLGRRIERAQAVAGQLARALDQRPERVEAGLILALDMCDSALTYRARYLTAVQPALVLDLLLADQGNPRSLAFQLEAARGTLCVLETNEAGGVANRLDAALARTGGMVAELEGSPDPAGLAATLAPRLRAVGGQVAAVSDLVMRRYFALLPVTFTDGRDA